MKNDITTLYSKDSKGKLRLWSIKPEGDSYYQQAGIDGGKITEWVGVKCKAKNLGKTNQTTAEQQAISEAENKVNIKLKEGYYRTKEEALADDTFTPMLAEKYEDYKSKLVFPQIAQPKLDGARCNIYLKNGEIVIRSRSNRDYISVPHLIQKFAPVLKKHPTWVIDGELYNHEYRDRFEDLMSLIRQTKPSTQDLEKSAELIDLYVYDIYDTADPKCNNMGRIQNLAYLKQNFEHITTVHSTIILFEKDVQSTLDMFLEQGYEGMMLRNPSGLYKPNGRSKDLLKCKLFSDEEFKILDVLEGNGAWQGCAKKILIDLGNGKKCDASLKGTQEKLADVLKNKANYINKYVTVTYFGKTNGDLLRFPVCKDINGRHD